MDKFKKKLKKGSIYRLKSFIVIAAQPKYTTADDRTK
jgi:hypothetical protein